MARFDRLEFDDEADREIEDSVRRDASEERDGDAWLRKADDHRRRGLHENALRFYSRALEFDRTLVRGWVGQVQMLVLLGEYPEAELWAKKSLEIFKNHGDLMAGRAQALARVGDQTVALELADAALRQEGESAYRWMVRGEVLVTALDEIDVHCFDRAVQAEREWLVPLEIALIYLYHERPGKALGRARQAVEMAPDRFYTWFIQGQAEQELRLDRQAKESYERCLELSPRHVEVGRKLAELAHQRWSFSRGLRRWIGR